MRLSWWHTGGLFPHGCWRCRGWAASILHASLLPKYRGAAPIQWAVAMGESVTGNTTMLLEEGLDTGPILLQQEIGIAPEQTAVDLFDVLAKDGAPLVVETLAGLDDGTIVPRQQDHARATLAPILDRKDGSMNFAGRTATEIWNRWRGFQPWPGAYTTLDGKKLIAHRVQVPEKVASGVPGTVDFSDHRLLVACAQNTWVEITELQMEGKKRMAASDFLRGAGLHSGIRLG